MRLGRLAKAHKSKQGATSGLGQGLFAAFARLLGPSETESALAPYRLLHEPNILRRGFFFNWVEPTEDFVSPEDLSFEASKKIYAEQSKNSFSHDIDVRIEDPNLFYEDVEGDFIVNMFGESDGKFFVYLDEVRRVANSNVLWITNIMSAVIWIWVFVNYFYDTSFFIFLYALEKFRFDLIYFQSGNFDIPLFIHYISAFGTFLILIVLWVAFYVPNQRNNGLDLRSFMTQYMAYLQKSFTESVTNSRTSFSDEYDGDRAAEKARVWVIRMVWTSFRSFFLECFARNVLFQIRRNGSYYLLYIPILYAIVAIWSLYVISAGNIFTTDSPFSDFAFYVPAFLIFGLYSFYIWRAGSFVLSEVGHRKQWIGFGSLKLHESLAETVGVYNKQIVFNRWRDRPDGT